MKRSTFKYLVIEDDKSIWKNISARMQKFLQWKAVPFTDSLEEAITLIDTHRPDLIFSDWSIRGGNAYPILTHIHQSSGYTPYIIFFTGYQGENPEIPQIVFNEFPLVKKYLVKPIFQQLTENLTQYIAEAEALAEGEPRFHRELPQATSAYLSQADSLYFAGRGKPSPEGTPLLIWEDHTAETNLGGNSSLLCGAAALYLCCQYPKGDCQP